MVSTLNTKYTINTRLRESSFLNILKNVLIVKRNLNYPISETSFVYTFKKSLTVVYILNTIYTIKT